MKMLRPRIALDARRMHGKRRGVGHYVYQLARRLPSLAPDLEFLLFVDRPLPDADVPDGCRQIQVGRPFSADSQSRSGVMPKLRSVLWMNLDVPAACRRERVSLFHGTNFAVPLVGGVNSVVTVHDLIYARVPGAFEPGYERYLRALVPRVVRRSRWILTNSEATRRDVIEVAGADPFRTTAVLHAADDEGGTDVSPESTAAVRAELGLPDRFVLHVGAVERRKNVELLLESCAPLLQEGLVGAVVLAGEEGHGSDSVRARAGQLGIDGQVRWLGYVAPDTLSRLYAAAAVVSLVSYYEGFGVPVLEAMRHGTPVVTANVSAMPEVAGDAAVKVSPTDAVEFSGALRRILTDAGLRAELVERGRLRAAQFSWDRTAAGHVEVYRKVLDICQAGRTE